MTTESPEVRAAAERRAGWRESCNYPDYPARSPYGDDGGSGRERIQDAMNLADAYLAIRAELARLRDERGDDGENVDWVAQTSEQLSMLRINSQVCKQCGRTVGENKQKYCGDGSDKDNAHYWASPMEQDARKARARRLGITLDAAEGE